MYIRIIGDTGSIALDLAERVDMGSGLGILNVGRNRKLSGSSIGCCRSENLSSIIRQLECKVPPAILRYAVLEQSLGIDMNVNPKERTESINIRVTPEEKAALKKLAAAAGMTLTGFLLGEALGEKLGDAILKNKEVKKK